MRANRGSSFWRWFAAAVLVLAALPLMISGRSAPMRPLATPPGEDWNVPGEIVVDLRKDATGADIAALTQRYGVTFAPDAAADEGPRILTIATSPMLEDALLARLRSDPLVEVAEPEHLFRIPDGDVGWLQTAAPMAPPSTESWSPNDPRYGEQWNFRRIEMEKAWPITHGKGAVVAVIDTGVAFENSARGRICRDFKDTQFVAPYDFIHRDKHPHDDNGHGTHVSGTIAESTNNREGVAGIAFEAKIMPIKVLTGGGSGRMSDVAAGIRYAADHGANVINMSLGAPIPDTITRNACKYARDKGVTIVCAAGNSGSEGVGFPAAYPECIAVSALGPTGELAPYSSWGEQVSISAPGGDRTRGDGAGILQNTLYSGQDDYFSFQGTSMACPHVAGVAALIVSQGVKDPAEVRSILEKTAQPRGPRVKYGAGEVNAAAAAKQATGESTDYYGRLGLIALVWTGAFVAGALRKRPGAKMPWVGALAVTLGLFFPDVIAAFAGYESIWNLLGHSALVPAFLLIFEADGRAERSFYGLFAAGLAWHLAGDLWHGTAPLLGSVSWAALPWLWSNVGVGIGTFIAGLRR